MSGWDGLGKAANVVQLLQTGYSIVKRAVVTYTTHANTGGQHAIPGDESEVKAAQQLKAAGEWLAQAAEVLDGVPDAEREDINRLLLEYQAAKSLRQLSEMRARCMDNYRVLRLDYVAATRAKHYDAWDLMSEQLGYLIEELKDLHLDATTTTTLPAKERKQIREGKNAKIRSSSPARISVADLELGVNTKCAIEIMPSASSRSTSSSTFAAGSDIPKSSTEARPLSSSTSPTSGNPFREAGRTEAQVAVIAREE